MKKKIELKTGDRFGKLSVVCLDHIKKYTSPKGINQFKEYYLCVCDCGRTKITQKQCLLYGGCKSCGCLEYANQISKEVKHRTHGYTGTRLYKCWCNMISRCYRKNDINYKHYHDKLGITVCDEWKNNSSSFIKWALKNGYQDNLTLDRIDTYKGYYPENCRWVTHKEQMCNQTTNRNITIDGETKLFTHWCKFYNIHRRTVTSRIEKGWSIKEALTTPPTIHPKQQP